MNRRILNLAVPNMISNITIPLVGMVDIAIAGRLGDETMIGAVAVATAIFNFIYWNFAFLRMGTTGLTAQAYGARNFTEISSNLARSIAVALLAALLLVVFQKPIGRLMFVVMNTSDTAVGYVADYFFARVWAIPASLSLFAIQGWFIGMQNSKFPMYISIVINVVNIIFGVWFAMGLGLGIAGLGWAVVIAQYTGLLVSVVLWYVYYGRFRKYIDLRRALDLKPMLHFFRVNRDIFLRTLCIVIVYTFFTAASSKIGDTMLAVNSLLMQLFTLFSYLMDGFAFAGESLVGRYVGAKNPVMVKKHLYRILLWGLGVAALYSLAYVLFGEQLLGIFTTSQAIIAEAENYMIWIILIPLIGFAPFLIDGALIGATKTVIMRNSVFISTLVFFAVYYSLSGVMGNNALWLAFVMFIAMRGILQYFMTGKLNIN